MSDPQSLLRRWTITPDYPDDPTTTWTAKCLCGWTTAWEAYTRARTACMYHYYVCPKRFELPECDEHI